jgi:hypothetical chaperone protein
MVIGIDFGTSNTVASSESGLVPLGPDGPVLPSLMYFDDSGRLELGSAARAAYGEALRSRSPERFRFFQGLKFALRDPDFSGTKLFGRRWSVEQLVGAFLRETRKLASASLGAEPEVAVMGRPVSLSRDPASERALEDRYREACEIAGFKESRFVLEPVAAASSMPSGDGEPALVFDFGGGTLDVAVVRAKSQASGGRAGIEVLSSAGRDLGGYALNEDLSRARVIGHFGYGSTFRTMTGRELEIPYWITNQVASFYALPLADVAHAKDVIRGLLSEAKDRRKLLGLVDFLDRNLGYLLFERIDEAKVRLSSRGAASIGFEVPPHVSFDELVSRDEFEGYIAGRVESARELVLSALELAGLRAEDVASVTRVGGSSRVPCFVSMLEGLFPGRVREGEVFTSIASGLIGAWRAGLCSRAM